MVHGGMEKFLVILYGLGKFYRFNARVVTIFVFEP